MHRSPLIVALLVVASFPLHAQLRVTVKMPRETFILNEELNATVQITNLAGRPLFLRDTPDSPWLSFQSENVDTGRFATALKGRPTEDPLLLEVGQTLEHTVDLQKYLSLNNRGIQQITAQIFIAELDRFFTSPRLFITMSDGRKLWSQTVGVPGEGGVRQYSLLNCQIDKTDQIYLRVKDPDTGAVFTTRPIAPSMTFGDPLADIDSESRLNVLTLIGPKMYVYYLFDTNGRQLDRTIYRSAASRPALARTASGQISVIGGFADIPRAVPAGAPDGPGKLSERPPGLPPQS
jgi:hypothetical protein